MRILVLGAGGIGGYFGGRIHDAGGDVTFLVRPGRAEQLRQNGLQIVSTLGNTRIAPQIVSREELRASPQYFDVIMLSCKAYDLASAVDDVAPAVGEGSLILPLLNGVRHIDTLVARFGAERVLGGVAFISVALDASGAIRHLNTPQRLVAGALTHTAPALLEPLARRLSSSGFEFVLADDIEQVMWDKFVFLSTLAASTCALRASVGDIVRTVAGEDFVVGLLDEGARVAQAGGHAVGAPQLAAFRKQLSEPGSGLTASMLRDVERGGPTEAEHILGDMVARSRSLGVDVPLLRLAYSHLQAYELRRSAAAN